MVAPRFSVVVPVCDEARVLPQTVPALLAAIGDDRAELVFVCNGCTDDSAALVRRLAPRAHVLDLPQRGKTAALNLGDGAVRAFPRFYVDADVTLAPGDLGRLARVLERAEADLVAPAYRFDLGHCTPVARAIARVWLRLPYARNAPFQSVLGLSAQGRGMWDRFPDVLADDLFIAGRVPPERRRIVEDVTLTTRPPRDFATWVQTRVRWRRGELQLQALGLKPPPPAGQRGALLALLPGQAGPVALFVAARVLADLASRLPGKGQPGWRPARR